jgi:NADPH:quinone reductase-like Zn-dependent oxidoreductase
MSSTENGLMQAAVRREYGGAEVVMVAAVPRPAVGPKDVLVRVAASTVTSGDAVLLTGRPYLARLAFGLFAPRQPLIGMDVAGTVEAVGSEVQTLKVGDEVFGQVTHGACAEWVCGTEAVLALKPNNLGFDEAAALCVAGQTALQGLRDVAEVKPGQKVLIIGASGAVGSAGVQIAAALGAEVTAVCRGSNADWLRSIGASGIVDYEREDFAAGSARYDVIFDMVGDRALSDIRRALTPTGVFVSGASQGAWIGPVIRPLSVLWASLWGTQRFKLLIGLPKAEHFDTIRAFAEDGKLRGVVHDRTPLAEIARAYAAQIAGHARGRHVVIIGQGS